MAFFPPIPTRYHVSGDIVKGKTLISVARHHLEKLRERVGLNKYGNLAMLSQKGKVYLPDGSIISMFINHGCSYADIYVPSSDGRGRPERMYFDVCFCSVNFAICSVVSRVDYSVNTKEGHIGDNVRYSLEACNKTHSPCDPAHGYVLYENMMITDFTNVIPDRETSGEEFGFSNYGLVMLYGFEDKQAGETPVEPPDLACKRKPNNGLPYKWPRYKVIPLIDPLMSKWIRRRIEC